MSFVRGCVLARLPHAGLTVRALLAVLVRDELTAQPLGLIKHVGHACRSEAAERAANHWGLIETFIGVQPTWALESVRVQLRAAEEGENEEAE